MPTEVERIAKQYLRHPVIIKIGDEESGKNKRIEQRVLFITEGQKKSKLVEELRNLISNEKVWFLREHQLETNSHNQLDET